MSASISLSVIRPLPFRRIRAFAAGAICVAVCGFPYVHADTLVIPGSGSPEFIVRELANAFNAAHSSDRIEVPPSSRSVGGMHSIQNNEAVLARVSRQPAGDDARGLRYLPFARDAVVFAAGKNVAAKNLSAARLADIFSGKLVDWSELGLAPAPIRVVVRNQTESNVNIIREHLPPFKEIKFAPSAKLAYHAYEMVDLLGKYGASIGFVSLSMLKTATAGVHPLALDGTAPTADNIASGKYPLWIDYGLVYKEERLNGIARRFLDFVFSEPGRKVLLDNGLTPLAHKPI